MSDSDLDLWPSAFGRPTTELPDVVLKDQASRLGEKTNHLVEATVAAPEHSQHLADRIRLAFYLVAPRLGNYRYRLFTVEYGISVQDHGVTGYPVTVLNGAERVCTDKNEFLNALSELFAAEATMQVISTLMSDSADRLSPT